MHPKKLAANALDPGLSSANPASPQCSGLRTIKATHFVSPMCARQTQDHPWPPLLVPRALSTLKVQLHAESLVSCLWQLVGSPVLIIKSLQGRPWHLLHFLNWTIGTG